MHAISSYRGNRPTNKHTQKHTHKPTDRTDYNTLRRSLASAQCNDVGEMQTMRWDDDSDVMAAAAVTQILFSCVTPRCHAAMSPPIATLSSRYARLYVIIVHYTTIQPWNYSSLVAFSLHCALSLAAQLVYYISLIITKGPDGHLQCYVDNYR